MKIIANFDFATNKKPGMGNFFTKSLTTYVYETIAPEIESKLSQYVDEVQLSAKPVPGGYSATICGSAFGKKVVLIKENENFYNALNDCSKEFIKQVLKVKEKHYDLKRQKRQSDAQINTILTEQIDKLEDQEDKNEIVIKKQKRFAIKPMCTEEAIMQMELLGHNFFVYMDADTEEVNVVYKRKNNTYGLIEPSI